MTSHVLIAVLATVLSVLLIAISYEMEREGGSNLMIIGSLLSVTIAILSWTKVLS